MRVPGIDLTPLRREVAIEPAPTFPNRNHPFLSGSRDSLQHSVTPGDFVDTHLYAPGPSVNLSLRDAPARTRESATVPV